MYGQAEDETQRRLVTAVARHSNQHGRIYRHSGSFGQAWIDNVAVILFFFSSRRRHTSSQCAWSSDVCSSDRVQHRMLKGTATTGRCQKVQQHVSALYSLFDVSPEQKSHPWLHPRAAQLSRDGRSRQNARYHEIGRASCRESA